MKRLPIIYCPGCRTYLEIEPADIVERQRGYRYEVYCLCRNTIAIAAALATDLYAPEPEVVEEAPPPKAEKVETEDDKQARAIEAFRAYKEHGSYAKAAEALGVSPPTVKNWMAYLPPELVGVGAGDGPSQ